MRYSILNPNRAEEYYKSKRLNVSTIKQLDNPKWIYIKRMNPNIEDEEKRHFRIGRALDTLLTDKENFNNEFIIIDTERPSGLMLKFIDLLPTGLTEDSPEDDYLEAYEQVGYKISITSVITKLWKDPKSKKYYLSKNIAGNKSILTKEEYAEIQTCREGLINNPYTSKYFLNNNPFIKIFYQVPLYFEYMGIKCKGLVDILVVNEKEKVIELIDLKTTGKSIQSFQNDYIRLKYYLQGAFYEIGLKELMKYNWFSQQIIDNPFTDYTFISMKFLVVEKKGNAPARLFEMTKKEVELAINGTPSYKGLTQYIEDYKWHEENDKWEYPVDMYLSNGIYYLRKLTEDVQTH